MWFDLRFKPVVGACILALMVVWTTSSARADSATDAASCLALVGGPAGVVAAALASDDPAGNLAKIGGDVQKGANAAQNYGAKNCAIYSENQVFVALSGALTALVINEQLPNNYKEASDKINDIIADVIAVIVKAALSDPNSPLYPLVKDLPQALKDAIAQGAPETIKTLLNELKDSNPFIAQIFGMLDCGVVVATSGVADKIKDTVQQAQGCIEFLNMCKSSMSDCLAGVRELGEAIVKGVAKLPGALLAKVEQALDSAKDAATAILTGPLAAGEYIQCQIAGKCLTPGVQDPACAGEVHCGPGSNFEQCVAAAYTKWNWPGTCNVTSYCTGGSLETKIGGINYCSCPAGQAFAVGANYVKCIPCLGDGHLVQGGVCATWTCDAMPGQTFVGYGNNFGACNYKPVCSDEKVWWNGVCVPALQCNWMQDPDYDKMICKDWIDCGPNQRMVPGGGEFKKEAAHCESCPGETVLNLITNTCDACPTGATFGGFGASDPFALACTCPENMGNVGGVCSVCPTDTALLGAGTGFGGVCAPCVNAKTQKDVDDAAGKILCSSPPRQFMSCGSTGIPDPDMPYLKCKPCKSFQTAIHGVCVNTKPQKSGRPKAVVTRPDDDRLFGCPTGLVLNADHTLCVVPSGGIKLPIGLPKLGDPIPTKLPALEKGRPEKKCAVGKSLADGSCPVAKKQDKPKRETTIQRSGQIQCPPGRTPNKAGTGCVLDLDDDGPSPRRGAVPSSGPPTFSPSVTPSTRTGR